MALIQTVAMGLNRTYIIRAQSVARRLAELRYQNSDALEVVMLDLDGLKRVNAECGHGRGDVLLCTIAERLVHAVDSCIAGSPDAATGNLTACAGFSLYPTHGRTLDELISAAELAVLTVKAVGRPSRVSNIVVRL